MAWGRWSLLMLAACGGPLEAGEVRMAAIEDAVTYELRSVVVMRGSTCAPVTAYVSVGGAEQPAVASSCWRDGDLLEVQAEHRGVQLIGNVDVGVEPWQTLGLVIER